MASSLLLFSPPPPITKSLRQRHHCRRHLDLLHKTPLSRATPSRASKNSNNNNNSSAGPPDRILSAACYLYPFLDGVRYGRYVLTQFPILQLPLRPLIPFINIFNSFPLNSFLLFLALYFAVVRNPSAFSRYVRFNTMQAIVLDVLLIFPDLIERSFNPRNGIGLDLVMSMDSTVFLFLLVSLVYGSGSCLLGQVPRLPIVAEAAETQIM